MNSRDAYGEPARSRAVRRAIIISLFVLMTKARSEETGATARGFQMIRA